MTEQQPNPLVAMVRQPDPYTQPYDAVPIYVDPSAVVAMHAEGWRVVPVPAARTNTGR